MLSVGAQVFSSRTLPRHLGAVGGSETAFACRHVSLSVVLQISAAT
jgi:hypothetical protein